MCTHPIDATSVHLLHCTHGNKHTGIHDAIVTLLLPLHEMSNSMWDNNNYTHKSFNHVPLFSSTNWHCAHQRWNLFPSQCCYCQSNTSGFTSFMFAQPKYLLPPKQLKPKKKVIATNTPLIISSLSRLKCLDV